MIPSPFYIEQIELGPMQNQLYILADTVSKQAFLVDPAWDVPYLLQRLETLGVHLMGVLLTHGHHDHTNGIPALLQQFPALPVYISKHELTVLKPKTPNLVELLDQELLLLGQVEITCIHTPGHSPGGQCFWIEDTLITGDTLFINGCGRTDLPGSDPDQLLASFKKLIKLPDHLIVYPGHRYHPKTSDTLGEQKKSNRFLASV